MQHVLLLPSRGRVSSSPSSDQAVASHVQDLRGSLRKLKTTLRRGLTLANRPGVKLTLNRCPTICGKQQRSKTIGSLIEKNGWPKPKCRVVFPRLAASRRRQQDPAEVVLNSRYLLREEEEADRQYLIEEVAQELRPQHPLSYDAFNLCECAREINVMYQCLNKSCAILKFHLNQETRKET